MSKSVGTGPSSYEKIIYLAAVPQILRNTGLGHYTAVDNNTVMFISYYKNIIKINLQEIQGDSVARVPKLLSIKFFFIEIMT